MPPTSADLLHEIRSRGDQVGFNLVGAVDSRGYDGSRPPGGRLCDRLADCGTVVVVGSGGRGHWTHLWQGQAPPAPRPSFHPIEASGQRWALAVAASLRERGIGVHVVTPESDPMLAFAPLAEMAGLGTVSPVTGLLLHPEFGPWVSLRAAFLLSDHPLGPVAEDATLDFQPCRHCPRPCVTACPSEAMQPVLHGGTVDQIACGQHRHRGGCADSCAVRRACPIGAEHRYSPDEERFRHAYSLPMLRRYLGLGWWRWLPRAVRHRNP